MARKTLSVPDAWSDDESARVTFNVLLARTAFGPNRYNPVYEFEGWRVSRHQWVMPTNHWAWKADRANERTLYGDTLPDIAREIIKRERQRGA